MFLVGRVEVQERVNREPGNGVVVELRVNGDPGTRGRIDLRLGHGFPGV